MLQRVQASSIGIHPPRTASTTAALRRTVHRWPARGNSGTCRTSVQFSGCAVSICMVSLPPQQPDGDGDEARQEDHPGEECDAIWRDAVHLVTVDGKP